ncbi:hypothetical protein AB8S42_26140, partial [Klebsiella pneumoniae]
SAEFTIGEGELMAHDVPLGCAPDEYDDLISGTCSHLPKVKRWEHRRQAMARNVNLAVCFLYSTSWVCNERSPVACSQLFYMRQVLSR